MTGPTASTSAALTSEQKAAVLVEALPWLQRFAGAVVVVKYGGNAMVDDDLRPPSPPTSPSCGPRACGRWSCTAAARRSAPCSAGWASRRTSAAACA